jgi:hypothetical protein
VRSYSRRSSRAGISSAAAKAFASSSGGGQWRALALDDRGAPAEQRLLAGVMEDKVAELVADREPARGGPVACPGRVR